ncbi:MAG: hypothetical protein JWN48_5461, partial [Myxococcaceae bacterium]|nr:hypothetical protein [Myxococcaceae bacterium]
LPASGWKLTRKLTLTLASTGFRERELYLGIGEPQGP